MVSEMNNKTGTDNQPSPATSAAPWKVAALYKFVSLPDYRELRIPLLEFCTRHNIKGTLLLAEEGINGTVAGTPEAIDALTDYLHTGNRFAGRFNGIDIKYSTASRPPFLRMKVRLKQEIVTLRAPEANPAKRVGTYVEPENWNTIIEEADIVIDTRNDYEVRIGTFEKAVNPETASFTEFKEYVEKNLSPKTHKKVAMFCTGGIRCEKASAYMLEKGFDQVWHLKGGILKYLETVPEEDSKWEGACFVFDERVALEHGLKESDYLLCYACRRPLSAEDTRRADYIEGVQCHQCKDEKSDRAKAALIMRHKQVELAQKRGMQHLGDRARLDAIRRRKTKEQQRRAHAARSTASVSTDTAT